MNDEGRNRLVTGLLSLGLALGTLLVYLPSLRNDFIEFDDQQYVTENRHIQAGLTLSSLIWAFGFHAGNWHPLTWISHALDCQLYGLNPAGHHLTNVLLHVANVLLLFLLLRRMTGAIWPSAAVAALFAWHPLRVESVAWVAERKDVLSALFWMLTLLAYTGYVKASSSHAAKARRSYLLTLTLFALGLMSKPMLVTLPCVMLLLDYWPLQRFRLSNLTSQTRVLARLFLEKVPFFVLTAVACYLTVSAQKLAIVSTSGLPLPQRIGHALIAYLEYLWLTFVPTNLAVYYPYETVISTTRVLAAALILAGVTVSAVRLTTRCPYFLVGWLWYLGTLVPVIGFVQVGDQAWADRYTYIPSVGISIMLVWSLAAAVGKVCEGRPTGGRARIVALTGVAMVAIVGMALLTATSLQLRHWKNTRTLFEHTARVTRDNYLAVTLLGSQMAKEGKLSEAMEYYETAMRYKPGYPEAHFFMGHALDQQGKLDEAIAQYQLALWFKPMQETTHIFLGAALAKKKQEGEAAAHYAAALELNPESSVAHNNFARLLHSQGRLDEAIEHYIAALEINPNLAPAHNNLGVLLLQKGRTAEGVAELREALKLNPGDAETQFNLAVGLNEQGQWSEAATLFAKTVRSDAADPNAQYQFGRALAGSHQVRAAMSRFASALLVRPDFPEALDSLSWILATQTNPEFRNGVEAVHMAERACELNGWTDPAKLKTLAAAYAEAGRFPDATLTVSKAQALAVAAGNFELADVCQQMFAAFKEKQPWRTSAEHP